MSLSITSSRATAITLLGLALPLCGMAQSTTPYDTPKEVSFAKDIAPILYENCVKCHRAGGVAPMSLMTYDEVRP